MPSLKSRALIFVVRNRHLFQGRLRPEVITDDTDTETLRAQFERGARRMGGVPAGIDVVPERIGEMYAEWISLPARRATESSSTRTAAAT